MKNAIVDLLLSLSIGWFRTIAWLLGGFLRFVLLFRPVSVPRKLGRPIQGEQR